MDGTLAPGIVWAAPRGTPAKRKPDRSPSEQQPRPVLSTQSLRDVILFLAGLAGLYHQFVIADEAQWILVVVAAAAAGIPLPLRLDERRKNGSNGS